MHTDGQAGEAVPAGAPSIVGGGGVSNETAMSAIDRARSVDRWSEGLFPSGRDQRGVRAGDGD